MKVNLILMTDHAKMRWVIDSCIQSAF